MKEKDNRLLNWAVREVEQKYKDDVSLLLEHNLYSLEHDRDIRYVNTIVSDKLPYVGLARTFIIGEIGYDFNQLSWESFERDAELKGYYTTVLATADIIYAKNEFDRQRFLYLRAKFFSNLADRNFSYKSGLEWINNAMEIYKTMLFTDSLCEARTAIGYISRHLAVALACLNQTYFCDFDELKGLLKFNLLPTEFINLYTKAVKINKVEELKQTAHKLISVTRDFYSEHNPQPKTKSEIHNYQYLADWYQECSYYFRRIYHFCNKGEIDVVFRLSTVLQPDLDELARNYILPDLDVLKYFDSEDLSSFADKLKFAEKTVVDAITSNGVRIDKYSSVDEFIDQNA